MKIDIHLNSLYKHRKDGRVIVPVEELKDGKINSVKVEINGKTFIWSQTYFIDNCALSHRL